MANVQHSALTGSELHEPKGVASATDQDVYVADGAGSGAWGRPFQQGSEVIGDNQTIISANGDLIPLATWTNIQNDGVGTGIYASSNFFLSGHSTVWDTSNDRFDWASAGLSVGDVVLIDCTLDILNFTTFISVETRLVMGAGHATETEFTRYYYTPGGGGNTYSLGVHFHTIIKDTNWLNNPANLQIYSSTSNTYYRTYPLHITIIPRNPVNV